MELLPGVRFLIKTIDFLKKTDRQQGFDHKMIDLELLPEQEFLIKIIDSLMETGHEKDLVIKSMLSLRDLTRSNELLLKL